MSHQTPARGFRDALTKVGHAAPAVRPVLIPLKAMAKPLAEVTVAHQRLATQLQTARVAMNETVEHRETSRHEGRMLELVCRELQQAFDEQPNVGDKVRTEPPLPSPRVEPPPLPWLRLVAAKNAEQNPPPPELGKTRTQAALALVERIDVFMRGALPRLSLTLNNALGSTVDIERMGHRAIAVRLTGQNGPPPPDVVTRLREALKGRGLRLLAMSVA